MITTDQMATAINKVLGEFPPEVLKAICHFDIKVQDYRLNINEGGGFHLTFWRDVGWREKFWKMGPVVTLDTTMSEFEYELTDTIRHIIISKALE